MTYARLALLLSVAALLAGGCDTSFEPFDENNETGPYSVVGFLDPVADTQFVRVEALRDSVLVGGPIPDARVTSTHLESGEATTWRDTLLDVGGDAFVPIFYTTVPVEPEARYRFTVERRRDGATSRAEVTAPRPLAPLQVTSRVPAVGQQGGPDEIALALENADAIGGVRADLRYQLCVPGPGDPCFTAVNTFFYLDRVQQTAERRFRVDIPWKADIEETLIGGEFFNGFYEFTITVAGVSETWPDYGMSIDSVRATLPPPSAEVSNIENGTGFLGGAAVRTVRVPTGL